MLPENVKWDAVFQSIVDTWLPLIGVVAAAIVIAVIVHVVKKKKEIRIDEYTGTYTADYENFSDTAYLFGGTSIKREAGKELSIDCTLEVTEGTAKVFWISGSDEAVTLIEASILDNVTRESVESTLVKNGNRLVRNSIDVSV